MIHTQLQDYLDTCNDVELNALVKKFIDKIKIDRLNNKFQKNYLQLIADLQQCIDSNALKSKQDAQKLLILLNNYKGKEVLIHIFQSLNMDGLTKLQVDYNLEQQKGLLVESQPKQPIRIAKGVFDFQKSVKPSFYNSKVFDLGEIPEDKTVDYIKQRQIGDSRVKQQIKVTKNVEDIYKKIKQQSLDNSGQNIIKHSFVEQNKSMSQNTEQQEEYIKQMNERGIFGGKFILQNRQLGDHPNFVDVINKSHNSIPDNYKLRQKLTKITMCDSSSKFMPKEEVAKKELIDERNMKINQIKTLIRYVKEVYLVHVQKEISDYKDCLKFIRTDKLIRFQTKKNLIDELQLQINEYKQMSLRLTTSSKQLEE